jgi:N-methylhydantoinase A/oxoprolinase/acetone carboxylase beta subunit
MSLTLRHSINTVASGGSSRLFWRNGLFVVGPDSAGAHPGPTCYRKGGPLAITDANLVTGHLAVEVSCIEQQSLAVADGTCFRCSQRYARAP